MVERNQPHETQHEQNPRGRFGNGGHHGGLSELGNAQGLRFIEQIIPRGVSATELILRNEVEIGTPKRSIPGKELHVNKGTCRNIRSRSLTHLQQVLQFKESMSVPRLRWELKARLGLATENRDGRPFPPGPTGRKMSAPGSPMQAGFPGCLQKGNPPPERRVETIQARVFPLACPSRARWVLSWAPGEALVPHASPG
jgi:hypothetical protein